MTSLPLLEDLGDLCGRSVLVRADFNVPMLNGEIIDDLRIRAALPTLRWLLDQEASVTVITHLGRPRPVWSGSDSDGASGSDGAPGSNGVSSSDGASGSHGAPGSHGASGSDGVPGSNGVPAGPDPRFSVAPIRRLLAEMVPNVALEENLRFHPGEIAGDPRFAAQLVEGHDAYVNDAFGVSHRAHASVVGPPRLLPAAAGRLLAREAEVLGGLRTPPRRPFVAVLGGAKVADKLNLIGTLLKVVDSLLIGGGMCFPFLKAQGHSVGASLCDYAMVGQCRTLLNSRSDIRLPSDITALSPSGVLGDPAVGGEVRFTGPDLPDGWTGGDIGPVSAAAFADVIRRAGTVLWNGPMGMFEDPRFGYGTQVVAETMAETDSFTVVGGGDSSAAVSRLGLGSRIDHVSTGGGASLELIEKGDLPGLAALRGEYECSAAAGSGRKEEPG